jgi:hypothetical protein
MNGWSALDRFLRTDPRDVGCAEAMDLLHVYAELAAADAAAAEHYPGIAAHLQACGPCGEDFDGLLAAIRGAAGFFDGADGTAVLSATPVPLATRRLLGGRAPSAPRRVSCPHAALDRVLLPHRLDP